MAQFERLLAKHGITFRGQPGAAGDLHAKSNTLRDASEPSIPQTELVLVEAPLEQIRQIVASCRGEPTSWKSLRLVDQDGAETKLPRPARQKSSANRRLRRVWPLRCRVWTWKPHRFAAGRCTWVAIEFGQASSRRTIPLLQAKPVPRRCACYSSCIPPPSNPVIPSLARSGKSVTLLFLVEPSPPRHPICNLRGLSGC